MATESKASSEPEVRTYRGRTLEEILPRIRAELGADAIIVREREGLVGGVGGFFAQRFIEVDAHGGADVPDSSARTLGDGHAIDIYDDSVEDLFDALLGDPDRDHRDATGNAGDAITAEEQRPEHPLRGFRASRREGAWDAEREPETQPHLPPIGDGERIIPKQPEVQTPSRRSLETSVFLERLRAASEALPDEALPDEAGQAEDATARAGQSGETAAAESTAVEVGPEAQPERQRPRVPRGATPDASATSGRTRPAIAAAAAPQGGTPARRRPPSLRDGLATGDPSVAPATYKRRSPIPSDAGGIARAPSGDATPATLALRGEEYGLAGLRGLITRLMGGRLGRRTLPRPSPPHALDQAAVAALITALTARGASLRWAQELVSAAGAHCMPFSDDLRAAVQAELAGRVLTASSPPAQGAVVAFVGSGGAGKTSCTAALASVYSRGSSLGVTVVTIDQPDGARELRRVLGADGVPVLSLSHQRAPSVIHTARQSGFVIVDTPTTTPTDAAALAATSGRLGELAPDAVLIALPATLSPPAAARALDGFQQVGPAAIAITHADETDQLAVAVELSVTRRIPLAYLHAGRDHRSALHAVQASSLAARLLA